MKRLDAHRPDEMSRKKASMTCPLHTCLQQLSYIQLLRAMIGQSFQLSNQDVRDSEAGCFRDGGPCGVRNGGACGGGRVGGAYGVRDGGSPLLDVLLNVVSVVLLDVTLDALRHGIVRPLGCALERRIKKKMDGWMDGRERRRRR